MHGAMIKQAWTQTYPGHDHLLFTSHQLDVDLSALHPGQLSIIKLWRFYLRNVNPLLMVTHALTMDDVIVAAADHVESIEPTLNALMFGIYCIATRSLTDDQCRESFGTRKDGLLARYQF